MTQGNVLSSLTAGMAVIYGGDRVTFVTEELAAAFRPGDRLVVVQTTGDLLHVPADVHAVATRAVNAAVKAFELIGTVTDDQITDFYEAFALRLADEASFAPIAAANQADVEAAKARGRSTTRLVLSDKMRADMISGLRAWRDAASGRGSVLETVTHDGWKVDQVRSGLGVVGFVFEGRPNVFADATGVLRSGNTVVFRIGSDALGTAKAIVENALDPALAAAGLPAGSASLVASPARAAGHALFSDTRLALAVARGSGSAVAQLGAVARQAGIAVSLHGTGGAWIVASAQADADAFASIVYHSLDRKVCNTLNTCCIVASAADRLVPAFLDALDRAGHRRGATTKLHVAEGDERHIPASWFEPATIGRAEGPVEEPRTELISSDLLGEEWEWEDSPEVTLKIVADIDEAVGLFNDQSPRFVASLVSDDSAEHDRFFATIDAPFVGDGFTRWVDGQYALDKPELGLSNWQTGRLFGRGGILSGDSVYTVRSRVTQEDPNIGR
ncbi:MAG TPA: aldehyde dehydrogenase family protein [Acidimicrobiia bacterium]|jgi:glutamate-5-semialdehyde dehydrogenase|nr:aldehyde dehydrogenase family protein [Acidimicrobiia bacterium]